MSNIESLRSQRVKIWEEAKAFLDERRTDGVLSAEDDQTYARMEAHIENLGREIEREERSAALERELARPTSQPLTLLPGSNCSDGGKSEGGEEKRGRASNTYRRAFWDAMRHQSNPFEVRNALREGTDGDGGYLVPDEFEKQLVDKLEDANVLRGLASTVQTTSGDRKIPVVATHGSASWLDEAGAYKESDESFDQVSLSAYKLGTFIKVSEELLADSIFDIETYLAAEFARRIGSAEEQAFLTGNGSGKPTGLFDPNKGAETGVTSQKASDITADELIDLFYSLRAPYRKNATWVMNDSTVKAIRKLKDNQGQYLWQPALSAGSPDMLLNRPIVTSAFAPEIKGGARTLAFGDLSYYWIADRAGRTFKRLNELFATTGQVGFLASQRVDGKLIVCEAVKVLAQKTT